MIQTKARAIRKPTMMPPRKTFRKPRPPPTRSASTLPMIMAARMLNSTMAVASLNRLSPSTSTARRFGAPRSLKIATTATGSVADRIAPSSRQTRKLIPDTAQTAPPTMKAEISSPTIARNRIGRISASNFRTSMARLLSKTSAGRKMKMMISDVISSEPKLWNRSLTGPRCMVWVSSLTRPSPIPTAASSTV